MEQNEVDYHAAISVEDVLGLVEILWQKYKGEDEAMFKMVFMACTVAELEILRMKDTMRKAGALNVDEVIKGLRKQAGEAAFSIKKGLLHINKG